MAIIIIISYYYKSHRIPSSEGNWQGTHKAHKQASPLLLLLLLLLVLLLVLLLY